MQRCDVLIIGAGFGGCLLGMILTRLGRRVVIVDKQRHPRFAIGESSTPAADLVLRDLAQRYDLPKLLPLTRYGDWQQSLPQLACGLKRGFSYFHHRRGEPFVATPRHANELLVTASASDAVADTHWHRADVDAYFAQQARELDVTLHEETQVAGITRTHDWEVVLRDSQQNESVVRAGFLVDASGSGEVLAHFLGLENRAAALHTNSRAVYGHFTGVRPWQEFLDEIGCRTQDYPFGCDDAALHHILDDGWMWVLRFNNGVTSAGFASSATRSWNAQLADYPSIQAQFRDARLVDSFNDPVSTGRLQRIWSDFSGDGWALLPSAAGFIDPYFSTGIAQTVCGIERLARTFEQHESPPSEALSSYCDSLREEFSLIDALVAASYQSFSGDPRLTTGIAMLYFAAATTYEQRRAAGQPSAYLLADESPWRERVDRVIAALPSKDAGDREVIAFEELLKQEIEPYNSVGLCDPGCQNLYRYTAAPK